MISKEQAVDLAVTYSAYQEALKEFCDNRCEDTAQSVRVWAGMLADLQEDLQVTLADKQNLQHMLELASK